LAEKTQFFAKKT